MFSVVYSNSLVFCSTIQYCSWLWTVHQQYYIPLPPRPLYSIVSPLAQSGVLFFKALAQVPVQIEHAHIYTHCRSFQLSNYDTVLCQKKDSKSTLSDTFFLALIQILMQAVDRIWLLVGLMYLLDPPQDPPCVCPLTFLRLWVENNIGIYLDSIYLPCQPTRSFEFVCLDSQCHKEFGSKPDIW